MVRKNKKPNEIIILYNSLIRILFPKCRICKKRILPHQSSYPYIKFRIHTKCRKPKKKERIKLFEYADEKFIKRLEKNWGNRLMYDRYSIMNEYGMIDRKGKKVEVWVLLWEDSNDQEQFDQFVPYYKKFKNKKNRKRRRR